jgi:hypothetical protein
MLLAHAFGFEELADLRVGKGHIATERRVRPIHLSFVARWSIWFALDVIPPTLPASSSQQRSKPTGKRAAGRRRVAG